MSISFPTSLDSFTNPTATSDRATISASGQMTDKNSAIVALETKLGINSSADTASIDYLLKSTSSSNPGHKHTLANGATDITSSVAELNILDGVTATTSELNYVSGVTSALQTQLNLKAPLISPSFTTPALGVATATSINGLTITTTTGAFTLTNAKTLTVQKTITLTSAGDSGVLTLPNATDTLVGLATTDTLTNKRITKRSVTITSSATPAINTDVTDIFTITALATAITSMTSGLTGTPTEGQSLIIRILDNATARAIAWGASFASRGATLPTTTVLSKYLYVGLIWNTVTAVWECIATSQEA